MKPMLLPRECPDTSALSYPIFSTPKLDGIRALVKDNVVLSRTLKPIPNKYVQQLFGKPEYEGCDGELIYGSPTADDVYRETNSFVMSHDKVCNNIRYLVFDFWDMTGVDYLDRSRSLNRFAWDTRVDVVYPNLMLSEEHLLDEEHTRINMGYEGLVLRSGTGLYKHGRCTLKEANSYKLKRFLDSEAVILDIVEEMKNENEATTNELGRTKRSISKAGLVGKGTMGALHVRDVETGVDFFVGSGFTAGERAQYWDIGSVIKYKYFPVGVKDKPRHPIYLGMRTQGT